MTRIIAGAAGGRTISVPPSGTRPTSDRVREAIFSRVESWTDVIGARVLDLFAGSGALGLEAASRGASHVDLVDNSDKAVSVITKNIGLVQSATADCDMRAHRVSVTTFLESATAEWDLVFIDPPYDQGNSMIEKTLELLAPRLSTDALVAVERSARDPEPSWPVGYEVLTPKTYGETTVYWLSRS
ncbi:MAG: 16S rRNA (guanine(966)-N(2))-methyltransferase RsmD [Microbacteriaceae bacterium]